MKILNAEEEKEVTLYGVIVDKCGKTTAELYELKALETEKQYRLGEDTKHFYVSRINKSALANGVWINKFGSEFIGTTKQDVIRAVIEYYEDKIEKCEAEIARANAYIEEVEKL